MSDSPQSITKAKVVLFSGGSGTSTIAEWLLKHDQIELTVVVNAYDDGLSTGRIRNAVPGMLGPSDIRKNVTRLMPSGDRADNALRKLLEWRLPSPVRKEDASELLEEFANGCFRSPAAEVVSEALGNIRVSQHKELTQYLSAFVEHLNGSEQNFDWADCSLGNAVFAGCFLVNNRDFNETTRRMQSLAGARGRVLNVTKGENLHLCAIKGDAFLASEAEIVAAQDSAPIDEIFLVKNQEEVLRIGRLPAQERLTLLRKADVRPELNPEVASALQEADVIVYGPGTPHSSLFPTYLTNGLSASIAANEKAEKILVGNLAKDFESQAEDFTTLTKKALFYLGNKDTSLAEWQKLITKFFVQVDSSSSSDALAFDRTGFPFPPNLLVATDWKNRDGKHSGGQVTDEILALVNARLAVKLRDFHHMVSIIVPGLNEVKTVADVLQKLTYTDVEQLGLNKEVIYVDGGSTDGSLEGAQGVQNVRVLKAPGCKGRGDAMRNGLAEAKGNIVVFFPCDGEYSPDDIPVLVGQFLKSGCALISGSRALRSRTMTDYIETVYGNNKALLFLSKIGAMCLNIGTLILYNRFISDPLTGIKVWDGRLLKSMRLKSHKLDIETEMLAKAFNRNTYVIEVPVSYSPRTRSQGKKTTVSEGVLAIWRLVSLGVLKT